MTLFGDFVGVGTCSLLDERSLSDYKPIRM